MAVSNRQLLCFLNYHFRCTWNHYYLFQVELLKDQLEETEEQHSIVGKELREKNREYQLLKRNHAETQRAVQLLQVSRLRRYEDMYYVVDINQSWVRYSKDTFR